MIAPFIAVALTAAALIAAVRTAALRMPERVTLANAAAAHAVFSLAAIGLMLLITRDIGDVALVGAAVIIAVQTFRQDYTLSFVVASIREALHPIHADEAEGLVQVDADAQVDGEFAGDDEPTTVFARVETDEDEVDPAILTPEHEAIQRAFLANTGYEDISMTDAHPTPREVYADAVIEAALLDAALADTNRF